MENKTHLGLLAIVGLIALIPFSIMYNGFVLSYLWTWFLVPLGLPAIGIAHSIGIMSIKGFMFAKYVKANSEDTITNLVFAVLAPTTSLGFGYMIHSLFM